MRVLCRSIACIVAAFTACAPGPVGRSFSAEAELVQAVGATGVVGAFDVQFPAKVVRIEQGAAGIHFAHGATEHEYPADCGPLQAVFVEHRCGRGVLVVAAPRG